MLAARKRVGTAQLIAVGLASVLIYAPAAAMCLNEQLPARSVQAVEASVVELNSDYGSGGWWYTALVECDGVRTEYELSRDEYAALSAGGTLKVIRTTGALGMNYTKLECAEAE